MRTYAIEIFVFLPNIITAYSIFLNLQNQIINLAKSNSRMLAKKKQNFEPPNFWEKSEKFLGRFLSAAS